MLGVGVGVGLNFKKLTLKKTLITYVVRHSCPVLIVISFVNAYPEPNAKKNLRP
jgi:hypothetical protein